MRGERHAGSMQRTETAGFRGEQQRDQIQVANLATECRYAFGKVCPPAYFGAHICYRLYHSPLAVLLGFPTHHLLASFLA